MKRTTVCWLVLIGIVSAAVITQAEPGDRDRPGRSQRDWADGPPGPPPGPRPPKPPIETALDADQDGEISADEIAAAPTALTKLDKNGDGKLTPEEYRPRRPGRGMDPPDGQAWPGDRQRPPRKRDGDKNPGRGKGDKGPDKQDD